MKILKPCIIFTAFLSLCVVSMANAQKLPAKQQNSLPAPANIKIDGKLTEWDNKFQAYNDGSRVFYTISNDANNLYLTIKMDSREGTQKALSGGITFSVISPTDKSKKVDITYHGSAFIDAHEPLLSLPIRYSFSLKDNNKPKMDSLVRVGNEMIGKFYKTILIKGIKEIKEPTIPIYNDHGIVVAARLNENMEYVYELALPLKLLTGFIPSTHMVKYSVNVNWTHVVKTPGQYDPPKFLNPSDLSLLYITNTTGFNGDYALAK